MGETLLEPQDSMLRFTNRFDTKQHFEQVPAHTACSYSRMPRNSSFRKQVVHVSDFGSGANYSLARWFLRHAREQLRDSPVGYLRSHLADHALCKWTTNDLEHTPQETQKSRTIVVRLFYLQL
jgi:hypothetical protein